MKKSVIVLGSVLTAAALGGALYFIQGGSGVDTAQYWDGKTELNLKGADGNLPLIKAVAVGDVAAVQYFLDKGADVDVRNNEGMSALLIAMEKGNAALFMTLVAKSAADFKEPIYLDKAIEGGSAEIVQALLQKGADVNAVLAFKGRKRPDDVLNYKDPRVTTPLKKAVIENKPEVVRVLGANGAEGVVDFLSENLRETTPEMVKALAENAGDLRKIVIKGMDLLTYAAGGAKPAVVAYLLQQNAGDVNRAFARVLGQRKNDNQYNETVELFLKAGAMPTIQVLELMQKKKNPDMFMKLAGCYANPNIKLEKAGEDAFMFAIRHGQVEVVNWLIEHKADIWQEYDNKMTPFKTVVGLAAEQPELLALFEKQLKDVNETGYDGETLLMLFAGAGDFENFQRIINKGGNIWQKDNNGKTMLMYAAEGGSKQVMDYLIFKGDNLAARDNFGRNVLSYAAAAGKSDVVKYLADKGIDISAQDNDGKAVLMYAAEKGHSAVVDMLINMGESAATADKNEKTVLMYAAESGELAVVETLLLKGMDVNAMDKNDVPVLSYAVLGGNAEIVRRLLKLGANVYAADVNGYTAMMHAFMLGREDLVRLVQPSSLEFVGSAKDTGKNIGIMAVEGGNVDLITKVLDERRNLLNVPDNNGTTCLMLLAGEGRPDALRTAFSYGGDIEIADHNGRTALMYAAQRNVGVNLVSVLKSARSGVKDYVNRKDNDGRTALMYAVGFENNQPFKSHTLLVNGADAKAADKNGKTVLMYAVANPYSRVDARGISEILAADRVVDRKDNEGRTALMYAAANVQTDGNVLIELFNAGAEVNARDNNGKTVLMYAMESGDIGKVQLLLSAGAKMDAKTNDGKVVKDFINPNALCFKAAIE
ncbi:MAG: ankyrin repeat domain-containing protein [Acetobacter sp.]|nr:ankyrin repeat domain-containing protein [Acetobacter sp.]